jgi:hypothetical protein
MNGDSNIYYLVFSIEHWMAKYWIKKKKTKKIQQYMKIGYLVNNRITGGW